jgi:hypothetical protein
VQIRSDNIDIQQFTAWVNEQNDLISKVEIRNDRRKSKMVEEIRSTVQEKYRTITKSDQFANSVTQTDAV